MIWWKRRCKLVNETRAAVFYDSYNEDYSKKFCMHTRSFPLSSRSFQTWCVSALLAPSSQFPYTPAAHLSMSWPQQFHGLGIFFFIPTFFCWPVLNTTARTLTASTDYSISREKLIPYTNITIDNFAVKLTQKFPTKNQFWGFPRLSWSSQIVTGERFHSLCQNWQWFKRCISYKNTGYVLPIYLISWGQLAVLVYLPSTADW